MVTLTFNLYKTQIVQDVLILCNNIGTQYEDDSKTSRLSAEIKEPDSEELKPIVARSLTEAYGNIKAKCQRYLIYGREQDDNKLEKIDDSYQDVNVGEPVTVPGGFELKLSVPDSFNRGITETLKSTMHRYAVDYVMYNLLKNSIPERAKFYIQVANDELNDIPVLLNSRVSYPRRTPSWT
jgi:hypothetical protein